MDASAPPFFGHPIGNGTGSLSYRVSVSGWEFGGFSGWGLQTLGLQTLAQQLSRVARSGAEWRKRGAEWRKRGGVFACEG